VCAYVCASVCMYPCSRVCMIYVSLLNYVTRLRDLSHVIRLRDLSHVTRLRDLSHVTHLRDLSHVTHLGGLALLHGLYDGLHVNFLQLVHVALQRCFFLPVFSMHACIHVSMCVCVCRHASRSGMYIVWNALVFFRILRRHVISLIRRGL
jgi:hypothetical protein